MDPTSLRIYLTIDVGPADAVLGGGHTTNPSWERTDTGMLRLAEVLQRASDELKRSIKSTWFLRADALIERQFSDRLAIFKRFGDFIATRQAQGDELGWMPQVYEAGDDRVHYEDLAATDAALSEAGHSIKTTRMGDHYHDNQTIAALDGLGMSFDSSALPGRTKDDGGWRLDWRETGSEAYRPSTEDYRVAGDPSLNILEVPLSMTPVEAPYDTAPLRRYVNPCMKPEYYRQSMSQTLRTCPFLVCIVHPDEVIETKNGHPLIDYNGATLIENLLWTTLTAEAFGRAVTFHKVRDFPNTPLEAPSKA